MAPTLILIGFMGSGKTAVGRQLARGLGWDFFDADPLVEREMGMSISDVFATAGEAAFRQAEEAVVLGLLTEADSSPDGTVLSLGGGAVTGRKVYERLLGEPLVVLLDEDLKTAFRRARNGKRPLAEDEAAFSELYTERESIYRTLAKFIIDTRGKDVKQVADEVVKMIDERTGIL